MRIDNPPYLIDLSRTQPVRPASESAATSSAKKPEAKPVNNVDRLVISPRAREINRLKQEVALLPDVRLDKVALAKQQIQQGAYRVDSGVLAQKMLEGAGKG